MQYQVLKSYRLLEMPYDEPAFRERLAWAVGVLSSSFGVEGKDPRIRPTYVVLGATTSVPLYLFRGECLGDVGMSVPTDGLVIGVDLDRVRLCSAGLVRDYLRRNLGSHYLDPETGFPRFRLPIRSRRQPIVDVINFDGFWRDKMAVSAAIWQEAGNSTGSFAPPLPALKGWPLLAPDPGDVRNLANRLVIETMTPAVRGKECCSVEPAFHLCCERPLRLDPLVLVEPVSSGVTGWKVEAPARERFVLRGITLAVECNVFHVRRDIMAAIEAGSVVDDGMALHVIDTAVRAFIARLNVVVERTLAILVERVAEHPDPQYAQGVLNRASGPLFERLAKATGRSDLQGLERLIQDWDPLVDGFMATVRECLRLKTLPPLPLTTLLRPGVFMQTPKLVGGRYLPAGCYIDREAEERPESIKETRAHELGHAAMAVARASGAVIGCRWLEEAFADFLGGVLRNGRVRAFEGLVPNFCESDVYASHLYLRQLDAEGPRCVEDLLGRYLAPNRVHGFCDDVRTLRRSL